MNYLKNNKNQLLIIGLLFSTALISHPFIGIKNDGILYFLQSLNINYPSIFNHDIFFKYGSQDQYTLFSNLYAFLIQLTNAGTATALLEFVGLFSWTVCLLFLSKSHLPLLPATIVVGLALTLDGYYGSHKVISYAEPYLTARLYAEIFSLAALGFLLRSKYFLGAVFYLLALANHPLITLPSLFIGLGLILNIRFLLTLSLVGLMSAIGLGKIEIEPFTGLTQVMDKIWFEYNIVRSPFVFLETWEWRGFSQLLFSMSIALYGYKFIINKNLKKLSLALLLMLMVFFTISYIGTALFKLPLIISLQLHRSLWVSLILSLLLIITLIWENLQEKNYILFLSLIFFSLLFVDENLKGIYASALVLLYFILNTFLYQEKPSKLIAIVMLVVSIFPLIFQIFNTLIDLGEHNYINEKSIYTSILSNPLTIVVLLFFYFYLINRDSFITKLASSIFFILFSTFALFSWHHQKMMDFQESAETYYDSSVRQAAISKIRNLIPESNTVYWINSPRKAWFWLKRANYVSFEQAAGTVFSRATTLEIIRRAERVKSISPIDSQQSWSDYLTYPKNTAPKEITKKDLDYLCNDGVLNFVIAEKFNNNLNIIPFEDPVRKTKFGLYACNNSLKE